MEPAPNPLLDDVARPIPGDAPAGPDASYDDDFLALRAEIDRLGSAEGGSVDFAMVAERSRALLATKSKDLRVASYLGAALLETRGFAGLRDGLAAADVLVRTFWDEMHPPLRRMPARRGALQFLVERLTEGAGRREPTLADRAPLEEAIALVGSLQGVTTGAMAEAAPVWSGLGAALTAALRRAPEPPADDVEPEPEADAGPASAGGGSLGPVDSEDAAFAAVLAAAAFYRSLDPANPVGYRLTRSVLWGGFVAEPAHNGGVTLFEGPPEHRRRALDGLLAEANWPALLDAAEELFTELPFHLWLDVQPFVVAALDGLGYEAARDAVAADAAALLGRLPGLLALRFADGTPLCTPRAANALAEAAPGTAAPPRKGSDDDAGPDWDEARTTAALGDLAGALDALRPALRPAGRDGFRDRLHLAEVCLLGGGAAIALPVLDGLAAEADRVGLAEWEPALALAYHTALLACLDALAEGGAIEDGGRRTQAFSAVCRLDPAAAVRRQWGPGG